MCICKVEDASAIYLTRKSSDYFFFDDARAALYAGGVAAVLVIVLVAMFVWIAYREEKHDAALLKKES